MCLCESNRDLEKVLVNRQFEVVARTNICSVLFFTSKKVIL